MEIKCIECGNKTEGRIDKKFCSDTCRNDYNNALKRDVSNSITNINNALRRNRRVLKELKEGCKVGKSMLLQKGFNFKYFTHIYTTAKKETYYYCYDYGYKPIGNDVYFLVKEKEAH